MSEFEPLIGVGIVILFAGLIILFTIRSKKQKTLPSFRKLSGAIKLRRSIGRAVEAGTRVHVSLGSGGVIDPGSTSGLIGLTTLDRIGQFTTTSDLPPMCTSGTGGFQILSQDVLRQNAIDSNTRDEMNPDLASLPGVTPFSYAIGATEAVREAGASTHVLLGDYGMEAGLLCESASEKTNSTLAGSNSMVGQSVFYALADETLIGEELYALPAYLGAQGAHPASLTAQDIARFLLILALVGGAGLKLLGWI